MCPLLSTTRGVVMGFASNLRRAREAAGLSQAALADRAGVPLNSVQNWEQGVTRPRLEALPRLADALGVGLDALAADVRSPDESRPRGRPRKPAAEAAAKRPRGRPRKEPGA